MLFPRERLFFHIGLAGGNSIDVGLNVGDVPLAGGGEEGVRRRSQPEVGFVAPIGKVVAGNSSAFREIGNFILLKTSILRHFCKNERVAFGVGLVGKEVLPLADAVCQQRVFLHGEGVAGEVADGQCEGGLEVVAPHFSGAEGDVVNQVEGEVVEACSGSVFHGADGFRGGVTAVQQLQDAIVEGLHANAQPVDAERFQLLEVGGRQLFRVGFHGKLEVAGKSVKTGKVVDDSFKFGR